MLLYVLIYKMICYIILFYKEKVNKEKTEDYCVICYFCNDSGLLTQKLFAITHMPTT